MTNDWSFAALNNSSSQDDEADLRAGARCQDQDCIRKLHHNTPTADNSSNNRETLLHWFPVIDNTQLHAHSHLLFPGWKEVSWKRNRVKCKPPHQRREAGVIFSQRWQLKTIDMRIFKRRGSEVIDPQLTGLRFDQVGHSCCWILELQTNLRESRCLKLYNHGVGPYTRASSWLAVS